MKIDAVIFDFGGVILDVDYEATARAMRELLGEEADLTFTQAEQSAIFDQLDIGQISRTSFYKKLMASTVNKISPEEIDRAWNAILGETRQERIEFLRKVGSLRPIFLLSNTNCIHKEEFDRRLLPFLDGQSFDSLFEKAYYSHEMGLRKPNPAIYRYIVERHGLDPERTLFIDDGESNLRGAEKAGLQTFLLKGELLDAPLGYLLEPPEL